MASTTSGLQHAKSTRTVAQMADKRKVDRAKKKTNRAESKARLENIERSVVFLKERVEDFLSQLDSPQQRDREEQPGVRLEGRNGRSRRLSLAMLNRRDSNARSATSSVSPPADQDERERLSRSRYYYYCHPYPLPAPSLTCPILCRCGVRHRHQSECLEVRSFIILYEAHVVLSQNPQFVILLPPNPTLPNYLLHSINDNCLTMFLGSTLKELKLSSVETIFGLYFLCYRLLRVGCPAL